MTQTYKILTYNSAYDLESAVNEWRDKGWKTSGDLVMAAVRYKNPRDNYEEIVVTYAQVMRKLPEPVLYTEMAAAEAGIAHSKN